MACNEPFIQASGFGFRKAIVGKTDQELWPLRSSQLQFIDQQVIEKQEQVTVIEMVETKKGIGRYLSTKMPFYNDGKFIGVIGNSIPIT